jgi:phage terminase large subunit GpA-like protein
MTRPKSSASRARRVQATCPRCGEAFTLARVPAGATLAELPCAATCRLVVRLQEAA